ncbi:hypothetical protein PG996_000130 [Apiospora saccharicola]|uniref:Uncharacterized protein n=1 Tax=Apiospora saccharicola TaxID=335842 RepID=A0ABR1WGQ8_9PEZI
MTYGNLFGTPASSTTGGSFGTPTSAATPPYVYGPPIAWAYLAPAQAFPPTPNGGFPGSSNGLFPFNNPPSTAGTRTPLFWGAASSTKPNDTPQAIQGTADSDTPPSTHGLAPPQDKTNKEFEVLLTTQVRDLERRLDAVEKGTNHDKSATTPVNPQNNPTPARPQENPNPVRSHESPTPANGFIAWLQQLDPRTPGGITHWKKAEVGIAGHCLVKFDHLDLILVTQGDLHEPFETNEDTNKEVIIKEEPDVDQGICHAGCVELVLTKGGHLAGGIPKYLLPLGSVYKKPKSQDRPNPPTMAARLYMDITKPSKSLWLVRLGLGGNTSMPFSRVFDLGDDKSVTFDVAKLVGDISTVGTSGTSGPILADQEQVTQTLKKSAHLIVTSFQNAKLIKPKASELEHAVRTGWAGK